MTDARQNLERCFALCHERAWRLAAGLLQDSNEAFDTVQQAFLVAAGKPDKVPADNPWPWFAQVVVNEARNQRRKKRPRPDGDAMVDLPMSGSTDPAGNAARNEQAANLRRALDDLPGHEREALVLTHFGGMTHAEAGAALGLPTKTVSTHVSRGLQRLRGRLGGKSEEMLAAFAAIPLMQPPGGWESAVAAWKGAAISGMAVPAATAATGGLLLAKNTLIAAGIALAIGLAGGAGLYNVLGTHDHRTAPPVQPGAADTTASKATAAAASRDNDTTAQADDSGKLRADLASALAREEALRKERDRLATVAASAATERDTLRASVERLSGELEPFRAEAALKGPTFTFGRFGAIEGVTKSDWKELGSASRIVAECIREIHEYRSKGQQAPRETHIRLQQHTELVRKYEYKTIQVLPTWARHNGELTHPISHSNLIAGELKAAGLALDEAQVKRIEALGLAYEADFEAAQKKYGDSTLRCEKLLDEYLLKGVFVDAVWDLLTPDQRGLFVKPETLHVAGVDLYCPTLMLVHTSPVLTGADMAEVRGKLRAALLERFKIAPDHHAALDLLLEQWQGDCAEIAGAVPRTIARNYTYAQSVIALRAHIKLYKAVRDTCSLENEPRAALIDDYTVYIPRVLEP
ncbi:MAG: sigma-70 family RNA polymerase sigma factor [Planctomycetes bacterium]|nr:sigma-70 family RNA polymerase sigma factor [Planctomycetota bacterium]